MTNLGDLSSILQSVCNSWWTQEEMLSNTYYDVKMNFTIFPNLKFDLEKMYFLGVSQNLISAWISGYPVYNERSTDSSLLELHEINRFCR